MELNTYNLLDGSVLFEILIFIISAISTMNIMITIFLLQNYHPSRVLTLFYQPFALVTLATLSYNEAKISTRRRILVGYTLFFLGTSMLIFVSNAYIRCSQFAPSCLCDSSIIIVLLLQTEFIFTLKL